MASRHRSHSRSWDFWWLSRKAHPGGLGPYLDVAAVLPAFLPCDLFTVLGLLEEAATSAQPPVSAPNSHGCYAKSISQQEKTHGLFIISLWPRISSPAPECQRCTKRPKHGQAAWGMVSEYRG